VCAWLLRLDNEFTCAQVIVAIVSGIIIDNLGNLRDLRSAIADDLESRCFICNIDRCAAPRGAYMCARCRFLCACAQCRFVCGCGLSVFSL
jgi:hypothetical protein